MKLIAKKMWRLAEGALVLMTSISLIFFPFALMIGVPVQMEAATAKVIVVNYQQTILPTATTSVWIVPDDWSDSNNSIEVIGAGGAGESDPTNAAGSAGGGGGAYSKSVNVDL